MTFSRTTILSLTRAAFVLPLILSVAGIFGAYNKYLELASHFRVQYLLAAVCCTLVFAGLRAWPWAAASGLYALVVASLLLPWYFTRTPDAPRRATQNLRLLLANVDYGNTRRAEFVKFIERENPDVIIVQEASTGWLGALEPLGTRYPFAESHAEDQDGSGVALFSRFPFEQSGVVLVGSDDRPSIHARLRVGATTVSLFTTHPRAPLRPNHFEYRNRQLSASAEFVRGLPAPKIFAGDLNVTPWSPYFGRLLFESGLVDARKGFGLLPTWPVWNRIAPLMLPIDHCLVSPDVVVTNFRTGPKIGSDHLPLVIDLAVPDAHVRETVSRP